MSNTLPSSIFIESREWFDKSGGNSYFSTRVKVDGNFLYSSGVEYGYEEQHIHTALSSLAARGVIPDNLATPYSLRSAGVALYTVKYSTPRRELFKNEEI